MRPDQSLIMTFTDMDENTQTRLRHILERTEPPQSADVDNFNKMKSAYDACLDEATVTKRGIKPLTDVLDELKNIYPAKTGLVKGAQDHLTQALLYLMNTGVQALTFLSVTVSQCSTPSLATTCARPLTFYSPTTKIPTIL